MRKGEIAQEGNPRLGSGGSGEEELGCPGAVIISRCDGKMRAGDKGAFGIGSLRVGPKYVFSGV